MLAVAWLLCASLVPDPLLLDALGLFRSAPGAWAEYLVRERGKPRTRLRVTSLVPAGEEREAIEVAAVDAGGMAAAARIVMHAGAVERMTVRIAQQQPIEIPVAQLGRVRRGDSAGGRIEPIGAARLRVRGGTFEVEGFRRGAWQVWRTKRVPLWGLVKARS